MWRKFFCCAVSSFQILLIVCLYVSSASALTIDVVSESHNVHGWLTEWDASYDATYPDHGLGTPLIGSTQVSYNSAYSAAGNFNVYAEVGADWGGMAYAESLYIFTSDEDTLIMNYSGYGENVNNVDIGQFHISLKDLTTNETLLYEETDYTEPPDWNEPNVLYGTSLFSPGNHYYELKIAAWAHQGEGGWQYAEMSVDFAPSPVPEPATMLLFGTGIAGLAAVGRKRRK